jgi:glycosyltransferase involved in cell wall biosynthesis
LQPHVAEILLIDMESSDRTVELARPFATKILSHPLVANFDAARNVAMPEAGFDWLWFLDADERIPPRTGQLVTQLIRERGHELSAVTIPFRSYFCGKWIEHCGWWPGYTMPRLLKRGHARFSERLHGGVEVAGPEVHLPPDPELAIKHFSYRSIEHYLEKFNRYTTTEAGYLAQQGQPSSWQLAMRAMLRDLWLYYEQNEGRLDGEHGWILSWLAGQYRWFSHAKLLDVGGAGRQVAAAPSPGQSAGAPPSLDAVIQLLGDELAALRSPTPRLPLGIVWRSPIWDPSGYADEGRLFLSSLAAGGRELAAEEIHWSDATCELPKAEAALLRALTRCKRPKCAATITDCIPTLCAPDRCASLNILRTTFETDRIPAEWLPIIEQFDEVWVFSAQDQLRFRRTGVPPEKLRVLPGFVNTTVFTQRGKKMPLPEPLKDRFVFLSVFDWQLRKGWDLLLRAYCAEFALGEGTGLLLKITRAHGHSLDAIVRQADDVLSGFGQSLAQRPDIVIWDKMLATLDMAALYRSVNAFVLASRGEGWGRPYMEAMASGLPTIGTRGSGNDGFMHEENSFLVSTTLVDVPDVAAAEIPVYRGHRWLEPSESELRLAMRRVVSDEPRRKAVASRGASDVRANCSPDAARRALEANLCAAETRFLCAQPPPIDGAQLRVELEGELFAGHSFSNINESLSLCFAKNPRVALSLRRVQHNPTYDRETPHSRGLMPFIGRPLPDGPQVTIRHAFPPNWSRPERGRWVHIQPWEFGALPIDWVPPLRDLVDEIWAPSTYVKRVYERSGIPADKVHVIPWGVDPDVFRPEAPPLLLPTSRRFKFLFVGGTIARKGFDRVLDAYLSEFAKDEDVCLVVKDLGTRSFYRYGNCRERVLAAVADHSAPEVVYVDRQMTPGQLASLYTACDCLVAPYRGEGFGLPILEAMACGVPPIVPRHGASDDFVDEAAGYLLPAEEVECDHDWRLCGVPTELAVHVPDLRAVMRQAYQNRDETRRKGESAAQCVHHRFTWEHTAGLMVERLQHLANPAAALPVEPSTPQEVPAAVQAPSITVCMLCQNNERTIADALGRIRPFVREAIVLDLGSHDRSRQIALEYGARLYGGQLSDDLGSLRNAMIRRATSDWILVLDADELMHEAQLQKLLALLNSVSADVAGVRVRADDGRRQGGPDVADGAVRLFRNRNDIAFSYRGCEQVDRSILRAGGRIVETDIQITRPDGAPGCQAGYRSDQTLLRLLHADLADRPPDPSVLLNLGNTHFRLGNFFHAECYLNDWLQQSNAADTHYRTAALRLIACHVNKGDPYRAREVAEHVLRQMPNDPSLAADIARLIGAGGGAA